MTTANGSDQARFWRQLFKDRPDLNPPGYDETVRKMGYRDYDEEDVPPAECEIEF